MLFSTVYLFGQTSNNRAVDIKIYFPYDEAYIDSTYMGNDSTLRLVDSLLCDLAYLSSIGEIRVIAQSSPEGSVQYNKRLSERRKNSLEQYFTTNYPHISSSLWRFESVAENWELFHESLSKDSNIPNHEEVLAISEGKRAPDAKEWLLRTLNKGESWAYIKEHILPSHRFGASVLFIPLEQIPMAAPARPTNKVTEASFTPPPTLAPERIEYKTLIALKTNLVWDLATAVNLGIEVPIGERFSVVGEVVYPWWRSWPSNFTMQIESYHGEVKYWLGNRLGRERLTGWSVGVYGGWGRYDVQPFTEDGVQGSFYDIGAEVGYALPLISNTLNLEFNLGLGYISTDYKEYYMAYDTEEYGDIKVIPYPWLTNRMQTVLPTRFGVSLVWAIGGYMKGGKL